MLLAAWTAVLAGAVATSGCARAGASGAQATSPEVALARGDAPYELADDQDLAAERDRYAAQLVRGEDDHALRRALADEYARRLRAALADPERHYQAYEMLMEIASLWTPAALATGAPGMDAYADEAEAVFTQFARAGGDLEAAAALYFLDAAGAAGGTADQAAGAAGAAHGVAVDSELELIFAYGEALAAAQHGPVAAHARPIEILSEVARHLPSRRVVDELTTRLRQRQQAISTAWNDNRRTASILHAHGRSLFRSARTMIATLARAERMDEGLALLADFDGLGPDQDAASAARRALAADADLAHWLALVTWFRDQRSRDDGESEDYRDEALHIALAGNRRFPNDPRLLATAGELARSLERPQQAIALYELAMAIEPTRAVAEELAELYGLRVATLAFSERPVAARAALERLEGFHARANERWPERPLEADLAAAYAAMGRGLVGLGELEAAQGYLERSLGRRVNTDALVLLGTIALRQDQFDDASKRFEEALAQPAEDVAERYQRALTLRLAGEALTGAGATQKGRQRWLDAVDIWLELSRYELPERFRGELYVEMGKLQWLLDARDIAVRSFEVAVDVDSDGDDTQTSTVSFLITRGDYERALDTYHRALGNHAISNYAKVYMSLWMLAEARRRSTDPDALALAFLRGRDGPLWYDDLARFATGRATIDALEARAVTRGRRAELRYYTAVLGEARDEAELRRLLGQVLATGMVLFFEYEMAKYWLNEGWGRAQGAAHAR